MGYFLLARVLLEVGVSVTAFTIVEDLIGLENALKLVGVLFMAWLAREMPNGGTS